MSNNLNLDQLAVNQASKEATINSATAQLDAALTEVLAVDVTAANQSVTLANMRRNQLITVTGATVAGRTVTLAAVKRTILVRTDVTNTKPVAIVVGSTSIPVAPGSLVILSMDGTTNGLVSLGAAWAITAQSGTTYTFALADAGTTVESTSGSATTFTLPANATVAFPIGAEIECIQQGAGLLTIAPAGGVTLHGTALATTTQYQRVKLRKIATDEWNCAVIGSGSGGGGSSTLATLTDVNVTEGAGIDGQFLKWDNATSRWIAATVSGGSRTLYEKGAFAPPLASWFSTVIGGPGTVTRSDVSMQGMSQKVTGGTGQDQIHLATRSVSGWGTAWRVRARLVMSNNMAAFPTIGLWIYDSGSGKLQGIIYENNGAGGNVHVQQRTSVTVFSANNTTWNCGDPPQWFELELISGNIKWRVSWDGIIWQEHSYALLNFLPAVTHIGMGGTAFTNDGPTINPVGFLCTYYDDPDFPASGHTV